MGFFNGYGGSHKIHIMILKIVLNISKKEN